MSPPLPDPDALLALLRDPNRETREIVAAAGVPRDDAARASRLVLGISKAKADDILTLPPPLALAVLRAAAAAGRADILAAAGAHPSKGVSKEAKRALYLLKSRGVSVPEPQRPPASPPPPSPEPTVPCYCSAIDGQGERALWLARVVPGRGVEVAQAVVSDEQGLLELHIGMLGRKEYRTLCRDLLERGRDMALTEIGREEAKSIIAAARSLNDTSGQPLPEGTDAWLARTGPAAPPADPAEAFPPLPEEEEQAALRESGRLHELPLVRGWLADESSLRRLAQRLDAIAASSLYVDERQRAESAADVVRDAVAAFFDESRRAIWSRRLFTLAAHLAGAGDPVHARLAAAAARALRAEVDAALIPFARLLIEKAYPSLGGAAAEPQAMSEGSLIVPPSR
jgi:hypothetical protein